MKDYVCPGCGTNDVQKYATCNMPDCPDGRDYEARRVPLVARGFYVHNGQYIYDAKSDTFDQFIPAVHEPRESWAAWCGRSCANALFWVAMLFVLKWLGLIIIVEKVKWPVNQW